MKSKITDQSGMAHTSVQQVESFQSGEISAKIDPNIANGVAASVDDFMVSGVLSR